MTAPPPETAFLANGVPSPVTEPGPDTGPIRDGYPPGFREMSVKTLTAKTRRIAGLLMTGVVLMACGGGGAPEAGSPDASTVAAPPTATASESATLIAAPAMQPPDFTGTYDVTAMVSSLGFLGSLPEPQEPPLTPGTTLEYRVDIACETAGCAVTTGPLPPRRPNVQVVSSAFVFPMARLIRDGNQLSLVGSGSGSPGCDYGDFTYSFRLSGTNPTTVGDRALFGGFTGSLANTFERLEGTTPDGSKCYPVGFDVEVTGVRVGGLTATPAPPLPSPSGPVSLATGTASIKVTVGSKEESFTAPLDRGYVLLDGTPDDTLSAGWVNTVSGNIAAGLDLNVPGLLSGTYEIDPTIRDSRQPYVAFFAGVLQGAVERLSCAVVVNRTPTGGVSGTIACEGRLRDLLDRVTAKGTFEAEP
jgi:hypothetical protein